MKSGQVIREGEKSYFNDGISEHSRNCTEMLNQFMFSNQKHQKAKNIARKAKRKK